MTISWYSINISPQSGGGGIFNGYFSVDAATNLIQNWYDLSLPTGNSYTNVILPINDPESYSRSDNIYPLDGAGLNFYSTALQIIFGLSQNHFNIYDYDQLYQNFTDVGYALKIVFKSISGPPSVACFKEDTQILTDKGYIPIQDLRKGDLVKTLLHDYKEIDMISKRDIYHTALEERIKDQLYKCSKDQYPKVFEPLIITGCHSILVDDFTSEIQKQKVIEVNGNIYVTDNKYRLPACADKRASVYEIPGNCTIYHLALENDDYYMNYGIYANGLLVETCSKRYLKELSNMQLIE